MKLGFHSRKEMTVKELVMTVVVGMGAQKV